MRDDKASRLRKGARNGAVRLQQREPELLRPRVSLALVQAVAVVVLLSKLRLLLHGQRRVGGGVAAAQRHRVLQAGGKAGARGSRVLALLLCSLQPAGRAALRRALRRSRPIHRGAHAAGLLAQRARELLQRLPGPPRPLQQQRSRRLAAGRAPHHCDRRLQWGVRPAVKQERPSRLFRAASPQRQRH